MPAKLLQKLAVSSCGAAFTMGVVVAALTSRATAATLTASSGALTPDPSNPTSFSLPYFNKSLGTLNKVVFQVLGNPTASVTVTNTDAVDNFIYANSQAGASAYIDPAGYFYGFAGYNQADAYISETLAPGASKTVTAISHSYSPEYTAKDLALSALIGTGS